MRHDEEEYRQLLNKKKPELQKVDSPAIEKDSIEKKEIENWANAVVEMIKK